ncbi:primosomal protein N' [Corynebacterium sp. zg254]|uniref:Probable replication restart protein PriA n=1 Tax=Corynebacterium zhongnanshanii TaxID=2768834 RepID=A0ABQ6VI49_9CORY|nr:MULTISPECIES: primosomal protein N' [Corynebacterium]KAB3523458.1 primosomal protein N' [Corynebacterium zhongnanshanii]MCR5913401.1 primosomal protein N' [Corynebacterium sp. zg254]
MDAPIARVLPLVGVPHLDRLFDYSVPEKLDAQAQPGVRVRVRFSGRLIDAFVIERRRQSAHTGALSPLERVISPQVVMPPYLWELVNTLATRSAGTRGDILRSFIPSRHATAEKAGLFHNGRPWPDLVGSLVNTDELTEHARHNAYEAVDAFRHGRAYLDAVLAGKPARASMMVPPGRSIPELVGHITSAVAWVSRASVLIIAPNGRTVDRVTEALKTSMSAAQVTEMTAAHGPSARYRRYLSILQGQARVVVGTRAAALAPLKDLRLIIVLGESDDSLVDPRAPYLHAREIARVRSEQQGCALLLPHVHRSAEVQQWMEEGFIHPLEMPRPALEAYLPTMSGLAEDDLAVERELHSPGSRVPGIAFQALREALAEDHPVLVQVPRRGYAPGLACARCRTSARCRKCNGPLELPSSTGDAHNHPQAQSPRCRWCGHTAGHFTCTSCGNHTLRMTVIGQDRTAEELGRAFPGVPVITSGGNTIHPTVPDSRGLVIATPGAEPMVDGGLYGAALLMDPWITLNRADLRAQEHALRQWLEAAALVHSADQGGHVVIVADAHLLPVRDLLTWNPAAAARRELQSRAEAALPPAVSVAAIDGTSSSIEGLLDSWERPEGVELLGPVELPEGIRLPAGLEPHRASEARRMIARIPRAEMDSFGASLKTAQSVRSSQSRSVGSGPLRVVIDPVRIG